MQLRNWTAWQRLLRGGLSRQGVRIVWEHVYLDAQLMQIKHIPQLHNMQLVNPKSQSHARCKVELVSPTVGGGASVLAYLHKWYPLTHSPR